MRPPREVIPHPYLTPPFSPLCQLALSTGHAMQHEFIWKMCCTVTGMQADRLASNVVSDAEPDTSVSDSDCRTTVEHSGPEQKFSDEFLRKNRIYLPAELKQKHVDVLLVFAENDRQDAMKLQETVNTIEFLSEANEVIRAKAVLQDEMAAFVTSHVDWLEYAMKYSSLICVLFTREFINDPPQKAMANASFWASVTEHDKQYSFIPVYLDCQDLPPNALSPYFKELKPLQMYKDGWEGHIKDLVWHWSKSRLEREKDQRRQQIEYFLLHRDELPIANEFIDLSATNEGTSDFQANRTYSQTVGNANELDHNVHANEQHTTSADDPDAVCRLDPDGSCQTETAAARTGCCVVSPGSEAAIDDAVKLATEGTELTEILLYAATLGIILLTVLT